MRTFLALTAIIVVVVCNVEDLLFPRYDSDDNNCLDQMEWERMWYHFDTNDDGNVTRLEFDTVWRREDFNDKERAPLFFMELDRVMDEVLNTQDFDHMFRIFDEHGTGCITPSEFRYTWKALFND